ncbi:ammonium transporter 2-like isoform X2 [Planococcus citri]|uniref:ammonium transporter 2-like isoform X2 n=1 Tax=Planococcus citri TaxID=170843 RepID=UPI0031F95C32
MPIQQDGDPSMFSTYVFRNGSDGGASAMHSALSEGAAVEAAAAAADRNATEILNHLANDVKSLSNHVIFTDQNLDDFFFIINGILVLLICSMVFWICGYALAFGDGNWFLGLTWWASIGMPDAFWSQWFFQYTFASTASTILSGAVAERCSFVAYIAYSALMSGVIYPIAIHWAWTEQGWLYALGFKDFGGGMLVHGLAGSACLVASILIGPRIGRFDGGQDSEKFTTGHSSALIGIGGIIILVGFCGFNAGTLNHYSLPDDGEKIARIVRNTLMCGAVSALTVLFAGKLGVFGDRFWPFSLTVNGGIAGLVASCGGCDIYSALETVIVGFVTGFVYMAFRGVILFVQIDDPLDSSPIHMACGIWSVIAVPVVGNGGIFNHFSSQSQELLVQVEGVVAVFTWSLVCSIILFGTLKLFKLLRSTKEEEFLGMDITKHRQISYSINAPANNFNGKKHARAVFVRNIGYSFTDGNSNVKFYTTRICVVRYFVLMPQPQPQPQPQPAEPSSVMSTKMRRGAARRVASSPPLHQAPMANGNRQYQPRIRVGKMTLMYLDLQPAAE